MNDDNLTPDEFLESIERLTRDLRSAAVTLSDREARFLVDAYYAMQRDRIRAGHQERTLEANVEPHSVLTWLFNQRGTLEKQIARALDAYSAAHPAGQWARSITGIGPIIAAGLICHIDIKKSPTVGHIWRFAGLDSTREWLGTARATALVDSIIEEFSQTAVKRQGRRSRQQGELPDEIINLVARAINTKPENIFNLLKDSPRTRANLISVVALRPWNAALKRLCYLIGESFVKVSNLESDIYGKIYKERKDYETRKNDLGDYADQAAEALSSKNFGDDTIAKKHYLEGKLPPARIHRRACRYAVKRFLSDLHHVMYEIEFKSLPPKPWVITHGGHTHYHYPPNWPEPNGPRAP